MYLRYRYTAVDDLTRAYPRFPLIPIYSGQTGLRLDKAGPFDSCVEKI
jgi:hypothetical protein